MSTSKTILILTAVFCLHLASKRSFGHVSENHHLPHNTGLLLSHFQELHEIYIEDLLLNNPEDLIVGDDNPDEKLVLTGPYYIGGNIIIINRGMLEIQDADFIVQGDIIVADEGQMVIKGSDFTVRQNYIYEQQAILVGSGILEFSDVHIRTGGYSWSVGQTGTSIFKLSDCEVTDGFITTGLLDNSQVLVERTKSPGEYLCFGKNNVQFTDSDFLLMWFVLPDSSVVTSLKEVGPPELSLSFLFPFSSKIPISTEIVKILSGFSSFSSETITQKKAVSRIR